MAAPRARIRIGEAAEAIGSTPKALRQWIERYGDRGVKPSAEQSGTWLEFSYGDVAALALTKYLVNLGMTAWFAFQIGNDVVRENWPGLFDSDLPFLNKPLDRGSYYVLLYTRNGDWITPEYLRLMRQMSVGGEGIGDVLGIANEPRLTVAMMIDQIVGDAFHALKALGHPPPAVKHSSESAPPKETTEGSAPTGASKSDSESAEDSD